MTDFYRIGAGLGNAVVEGQDIALRREREAREADMQALRQQQLQGQLDDASYARGRDRASDAAYDADIAPGTGVPTGPRPAPQGDPSEQFSAAPATPTEAAAPPARGVPKSRAQVNTAMAARSARRGDAKGFNDASDAALSAQLREAQAEGLKTEITPALREEIVSGLNKMTQTISAAEVQSGPDKGKVRMIVHSPNGKGHEVTLSNDQLRRVLGARAMMKIDPQAGLAELGKVNGEFAAAMHFEFQKKKDAAEFNQRGLHQENQDRAASDRTAASIEIASMRAETAALRVAATKAGKEIPAAMLDELNTQAAEIDNEPDQAKRAQMSASFRRKLAIAGTSIGKLTMPAGEKPPTEAKRNADGSITKDGSIYDQDPKTPGKYIKAVLPGESALDKALAAKRARDTAAASQPTPQLKEQLGAAMQGAPAPMGTGMPAPSSVQAQPDAMLMRYTPNHPDYRAAMEELNRRRAASSAPPEAALRFNSR